MDAVPYLSEGEDGFDIAGEMKFPDEPGESRVGDFCLA